MGGKTITLLGGAGLMGVGIVKDLLADRALIDIAELRLCDVSGERINRVIADLGKDPRLVGRVLDVSDTAALAQSLHGADLCLNAVPTLAGHQMLIFEAALSARVAYIDLGGLGIYTVKQKAEHTRFAAAGVPAVIGVGADPGMSNVLCRAVADRLETIEAINLYWAATLEGPENPVLVPPYSISTVLAEYARPSTQFFAGAHVECPPLSGAETLTLPPPFGATRFVHSPHSEQLTVPLAKGIAEKGIREFTWKLSLPHREHEAWIGLVKAGFGDFDDPLEIGGVSIKPLDFLAALIARTMERRADDIPVQNGHEIHLARGTGTRKGQPWRAEAQVTAGPDPFFDGYLDAATSMNASIAAQLLLRDGLAPGVWAPEEAFDVAAYLAEVERRHFTVTVTDGPALQGAA